MRFLSILFFILVFYSGAIHAQEWRLALCYGDTATEENKKYRVAIAKSSKRVFGIVDTTADVKIKLRQCVQEPDIACYTDESAIYCREEPFSQLIRIAAWLATERAFIYQVKKIVLLLILDLLLPGQMLICLQKQNDMIVVRN